MKKEGRENLTLTGHPEGKSSGKQRVIYLPSLNSWQNMEW